MGRQPPDKSKTGLKPQQEMSLVRRLVRLALGDDGGGSRAKMRRLAPEEIALLLAESGVSDPTAESLHANALVQALSGLPERRREIVVAILNNTPREVVAERYGLSLRAVDDELQTALEHALRVLQSGSGPPGPGRKDFPK